MPMTQMEKQRQAERLELLEKLAAHWRQACGRNIDPGVVRLMEQFFEKSIQAERHPLASPYRLEPSAVAKGIALAIADLWGFRRQDTADGQFCLRTILATTKVINSDWEEPLDAARAEIDELVSTPAATDDAAETIPEDFTRDALRRIYAAAQSLEAGEENIIECAQDIQRMVTNGLRGYQVFAWSHEPAVVV